jgi:penicillin-binding protein 1A
MGFWGRRKARGRKEPRFDFASSLSHLRLTIEDRLLPVFGADQGTTKPSMSKRRQDDDEDDAPEPKPRTEKKKKRGRRGKSSRVRLGRLIYWGAVLGLWGLIAVGGVIVWAGAHLPPIQSLEIPPRPPTIQIVGLDGSVLATRGEQAGTNVALKELPPYLPKAFIAIEDRRFYHHFGVDPTGILRALVANILHRGVSQGGSTLTQQLAKNLFLTQERTLMRKLQEAELALWLEHKHSKAEILELYLNRVYFGSGAYGVEAAAQRYFGKSARNVSLAEAAMLAGLVKSPSRLAPNRNPEGAEARAQTVLAAMADAGFITEAQAKSTMASPAYAVKPAGAGSINYVADWIAEELDDLIGQVEQSIVVQTTIDPKLQAIAEAAVIDELAAKSTKFQVSQGALVAMTPQGAVRAMIGGRNYAESQYNRATTAKRQPGSAFKPFVYLTAIEQGLTPDTVRQDAPLKLKGWSPENYSREYFGPVTLTQALAMSLNTVAVRVGLEVGPKNVVRTAHRLGISSKLDPNPSIALGTSEVTLIELVGAYAPFANGGMEISPHVIEKIKTADGKLLYARAGDALGQVIEPRHIAMMNAMMQETLLSGTARKAEIPGWQAAGKTGTSQDFRDAWFIGYTTNLVTGVWLGNDDNSPTRKTTGGGLPVEVWTRFMRAAHQGLTPQPLPTSWSGGLIANAGNAGAAPPSAEQASLTPPASIGGGTSGGAARPAPTQVAQHPAQGSGMDGWLIDKLFGKR